MSLTNHKLILLLKFILTIVSHVFNLIEYKIRIFEKKHF